MTKDSDRRAGGRDGGIGESIAETVRDHLRAAVGGLLVGLPLLWTTEMWEHGATLAPWRLLLLLGLSFAVVLGFNSVSGFRRERSHLELVVDTVQGLGLSILVAAVMLYVLGRLEPELGLATLVGRVGLLSIPVAFGTALAATVLSEPEEGGGHEPVDPVGRLFVAAGGALYFALNVAPTNEVRVLGSEADALMLIVAIVASLVLSYTIVDVVALPGGRTARMSGSGRGPLEHPFGEAIAAYAVALLVALTLIVAFELNDGLGPKALLGHVVMLGILASFGSAASRLLVGGTSGEGEAAGA